MPTPHIEANLGDFAKVVLMPGDPKRAEWIAKEFLKDAKLVTSVRGILGYTGYGPEGTRVSVMASGMGMPSIGIYSHELFTHYGVEAIIRIGTMGTYQPEVALKDVIIAQGASTDSNWMGQYDLKGGTYSAISDFELLRYAYEASEETGSKCHVGNIVSCDIFYDHDPNTWKRWASLGILGVEMEAYALYEKAASLKKKALALCTVTDSFLGGEKLSSAERQNGLSKMVKVAIMTAERYNKCHMK